jgi:hypothetical protein
MVSALSSLGRDVLRAWRLGRWLSVLEELRLSTLARLGGYGRRFVVEADLTRLAEVASPDQVEVRLFLEKDWALLGDLGRERLAPGFDCAADAGRVCLVAWRQRRAVGYAWFSPKVEGEHEHYDLPLPADAMYISQLHVVPDEQPREVAAALLGAGLRLWRDRGFRRTWVILHPNNLGSVCPVASLAPSRVLGTVARLKVLAWMRSWYRALHVPVPIVLARPT